MRYFILMFSVLPLLAAGCDPYYYDDPYYAPAPPPPYSAPPPSVPVPLNFAPVVSDAEAGVYWDDIAWADYWYVDAFVDDPDGPLDVSEVWANVYTRSGRLVDTFELEPIDNYGRWSIEFDAAYAPLDPYGDYTIELQAFDAYGASGYATIVPYTY